MIGRLACRLGLHRPQNGRTGPCLRECGHVTMTWTNGALWEKYVTPPQGEPPAGMPNVKRES